MDFYLSFNLVLYNFVFYYRQIMKQQLTDLYIQRFSSAPNSIEKINAGGSNRVYYRLRSENGPTVIGTIGKDIRENHAFITLANYFKTVGHNVPSIYAHDKSKNCYLQEDFGDTSLFSILGNEVAPKYIVATMKALARLQTTDNIDYSVCYPEAEFSRRLVDWDLNYFKYCFLKPMIDNFDESGLQDDFDQLAETIMATPESYWGFMYRDCQSRNVMINGNKPAWIDFQGGRRGPMLYDVVSFLWQAKAQFSDDFRQQMIDVYLDELSTIKSIDREDAKYLIANFVLFRTLQVLGAYGFRGLMQHKAHFIQSIPFAIDNLKSLIEKDILSPYPTLKELCSRLCDNKRFNYDDAEGLNIKIFSFSYKKGYPEDLSGNGGGFIFDCRAMHNPGRYNEYKSLTGLNREVIDFLEAKGEVQKFLKSTWALTESAIDRYLKRGFSSLQIGFGCTGGQHRSVYCAQSTAVHLSRMFPDATVHLNHREQGIKMTLKGGIEI